MNALCDLNTNNLKQVINITLGPEDHRVVIGITYWRDLCQEQIIY